MRRPRGSAPPVRGWLPSLVVALLALSHVSGAAEFRVNLTTSLRQDHPEVAADAAGGFVVVWDSQRVGAGPYFLDVLGQRFDQNAVKFGGEFVVNTTDLYDEAYGSLGYPSVGVNASGEFVVVWETYYFPAPSFNLVKDVLIRRFDSAGVPQGDDFSVGSYGYYPYPAFRRGPSVGVNPDFEFVVVWLEGNITPMKRSFDDLGTPQGVQAVLAANRSPFRNSDVATQGHLGHAVVWSGYGDGSGAGILGRRLDGTAQPLGSVFQINTFTDGDQLGAAVGANETGSFVVVWQSEASDGDQEGVFGQLYDSAGQPLFGEFQVNTYTTGRQGGPDAAMDAAGNFMVVWHSDGQDGSGAGVFGQFFDIAANPIGREFRVNTNTAGAQRSPSIAPIGQEGFVVVWLGQGSGTDTDIFGDRVLTCAATPPPVTDLRVDVAGGGTELSFTWTDAPEADHYMLVAGDSPGGAFTPSGTVSRASGSSCGDDVCEPFHGENCSTCPGDCNGIDAGSPAARFCCGDGVSGSTNPVDCGDPRCTDSRVRCQAAASLSVPVPPGDKFFRIAGSNACGTGPSN